MKKTQVTPAMSQWLVAARVAGQVSQLDLAEKLKVGQMQISCLERGKTKSIDANKWKRIHDYMVKTHGHPPLTSAEMSRNTPAKLDGDVSSKALKAKIKHIQETTKSSGVQLAKTIGVHVKTLRFFMTGKPVTETTLHKIAEGVAKLTALPKQLKEAGMLPEAELRKPTKKVRGPNKPKSIIEHAQSGVLTRDVLLSMRLETLNELLQGTPPLGSVLNGHAVRKHS